MAALCGAANTQTGTHLHFIKLYSGVFRTSAVAFVTCSLEAVGLDVGVSVYANNCGLLLYW